MRLLRILRQRIFCLPVFPITYDEIECKYKQKNLNQTPLMSDCLFCFILFRIRFLVWTQSWASLIAIFCHIKNECVDVSEKWSGGGANIKSVFLIFSPFHSYFYGIECNLNRILTSFMSALDGVWRWCFRRQNARFPFFSTHIEWVRAFISTFPLQLIFIFILWPFCSELEYEASIYLVARCLAASIILSILVYAAHWTC